MRIAILSDIHSNLEALTTVFQDIDTQNVDTCYCAGDIVGYGPNPNECIQLISKRCSKAVLGNHDAAVFDQVMAKDFNANAQIAINWTTAILTQESFDYLRTLPMRHEEGDITLVHSTPYDPHMWYYISSLEDARFNFHFFTTKTCIIGHTHIPGVITLDDPANDLLIQQVEQLSFDVNSHEAQRIINVGSVGQPRDNNPKASYVIYDSIAGTITFRRLAYDIVSYQAKMQSIGMPDFLSQRVQEGK